MSIGQLLKKYRNQQNKTQKEWCQGIISPSFYGKVEKDRNKIAVQDLLKLLAKNQIAATDFFASFNERPSKQNLQENELDKLIHETYYNKSETELRQLRREIAASDIANKDDALVFIDGYLELISGSLANLTENTRQKLKERIFNITDFTKENLSAYTDFMVFYNVDSNLLLAKKIVQRYQDNADPDMQIYLLCIIFNLLILCIMNNRYQETHFFIDFADKIVTTPDLFFFKNGLLLLKNMVYYHESKQAAYWDNCQIALNNFSLLGMPTFGDKLRNFFDFYTADSVTYEQPE